MQNIVILIIIIACAFLLVRLFFKRLRVSGGSCECGCSCNKSKPDDNSPCTFNFPDTN